MRAKLEPSRTGAPGSVNAHTLNGRFTPSYEQKAIVSGSSDLLGRPTRAIETQSPAYLGGSRDLHTPRQYFGADKYVFRVQDGIMVNDSTNNGTGITWTQAVQDIVACRVGNTDGLLAVFGNVNLASGQGNRARDLTIDSPLSWGETPNTGTASFAAWKIIKAGSSLYAVCDSGRVPIPPSTGDYRVSECPAGNDPQLAASWGNGIEVGTSEWNITGLAAIGNAPVVGKPDGLYYYSETTRRYENVLKHFELLPHPDNGLVTQSVSGGVMYTTYDGGAFLFDGVTVQDVSPKKLWSDLGKTVPSSRITAIADRGDVIDMALQTASQLSGNFAFAIRLTKAGVTTLTSSTQNGAFQDGLLLTGMTTGDTLDVFSDYPFVGVYLRVTRIPNTVNAVKWGTLSYTSAANTFTAYTSFKDGTRKGAGGSLSVVGFPPVGGTQLVQPTDVASCSLQTNSSVTYASGPAASGYGMRLTLTGGTINPGTELDEIEIVPARAGMPNGGFYTNASFNHTPRIRSGMLTRIISMRRKGAQGFIPHDSHYLDMYGEVTAMAWHAGRVAGANNIGNALMLYGRFSQKAIVFGATGDPFTDVYPTVVAESATVPGALWQIMYEWDGGDATLTKNINWVAIDTRYVEPGDEWEVFAQHDEMDIVSVASGRGGPIKFMPQIADFRYMNMWIAFRRTEPQRFVNAPQLLEPITVEYAVVGDPASWPRDRATQIPNTT